MLHFFYKKLPNHDSVHRASPGYTGSGINSVLERPTLSYRIPKNSVDEQVKHPIVKALQIKTLYPKDTSGKTDYIEPPQVLYVLVPPGTGGL